MRREAPRCPQCTYPTRWGEYREHVAMRRLFYRYKGKWKAAGWICPRCKYVIIEKNQS